ncbi:PD40 domain-containing protein [Pseudoalteromonas sp. T1lg23B]|uniref:PD40 domain-containing protein n=1 Tax=Pseudoalteromonas sp. T1lg23B TaxID=2077097 RepID=UPI0018FE4502|nr:PD40 domain-containing protein [Pseudoalteromonas sp. T1lg23B]
MKIIVSIVTMLCVAFSVHAELVTSLSSEKSEYNLNFHPSFGRAVLARSQQDFENAEIWQYHIQGDSFTKAHKITLGPTEFKYSDPMYSPNGKEIYFISDRPIEDQSTRQDYNIWRATLMDQTARNIMALDKTINSRDDEFGPEIHQGKLYFATRKGRNYTLMAKDESSSQAMQWTNIPRAQDIEMRSDLSFSPDGKVAVFWQLSKTIPQADIYASRFNAGQWSTPIKLLADVNSEYHEISPQFSPDGKWLYFSSERPELGYDLFNIHRVRTKQAFPVDWYEAHFAPKDINLLADKSTIRAITQFAYTLTLNNSGKLTKQHVLVDYHPFSLKIVRDDIKYQIDNGSGLKIDLNTQLTTTMSDHEINKELKSLRMNFLDLLKQRDTLIYRQYNENLENETVYRVESQEIEPFSIIVDKNNQKILKLLYDDSSFGAESDYLKINGIWWPHKFSFYVNNKKLATGEFSNMCISLLKDKSKQCALKEESN